MGYNQGTIEDCSVTGGTIKVQNDTMMYTPIYVGGIVGQNQGSTTSGGSIGGTLEDCWITDSTVQVNLSEGATVYGRVAAGGVVGYTITASLIGNNSADSTVSVCAYYGDTRYEPPFVDKTKAIAVGQTAGLTENNAPLPANP